MSYGRPNILWIVNEDCPPLFSLLTGISAQRRPGGQHAGHGDDAGLAAS